jgi:cell division protein FtsI (penicillin-binding protein 3)
MAAHIEVRQRLLIFAGILLLWLAAIAGRLVYLQVIRYGDFVQRAQKQQQRTIEVAAPRGVIYDRNGRELAMSIAVDSIFAVPSEVPDPATAASLLGRILQEDPHEILARLKSSRAFCWIARKVDAETSERIRGLNLKGIYFQKESKRFYPKGELAAQVLGYVGLDDGGLGGIERGYEAKLRGHPGKMLISLDARRKWFGRIERQPDAGENLVLTLDQQIQYVVERELQTAMRETHAVAGTVILQNPRTGEVLALANRPSFNPNSFQKSASRALENRAVSDIYEPGSTFKIVTVAAALEEKLTHPDEVIDCQMGAIEIAGRRIRDHKPFGDLSVSQIIAQSSDVGAIKLGLRLGEERFDHYIRDFGFGRQTGIELPGETRGLTKPVNRWSKISIGAISMGQEIGVSALQLISMISTIANGGVYTAPRIVAGAATPSGTAPGRAQKIVFHPAAERRVISGLTAAEMKKMLQEVVLTGTGKRALLNGYTSAGKTGTAQKADPATGRYSRSNYIASFAGFAPVNNPAISIVVILDSPAGGHEGGIAAAPVFARIAQQVLAYMNVPRDAEVFDPKRLQLRASRQNSDSDVADSSPDRLVDEAAGPASVSNSIGETQPSSAASAGGIIPAAWHGRSGVEQAGPVKTNNCCPQTARETKRQLIPNAKLASGAGTVVVDVGSQVVVPSMLGMPVREALETAQEAGVEIEIAGSGLARQQTPSPGTRLPTGAHVFVSFSR